MAEEQQQQTNPLEAVRRAIPDASDALLTILDDERNRESHGVEGTVTRALRLAHALGKLTKDQREALLLGAELTEQQRESVIKLLTLLSGKWPHDA